MALIKSTAHEAMTEDVIVLDLGDLRKQGEQMLQAARVEADKIIAEAREQAARMHEGSEETGHAEGYAKGIAEGRAAGTQEGHAEALAQQQAQLAAIQQSWTQALQTWDGERREMMIDARQSLLQLAVAIGKKIVRRMPQTHPDMVVDQVNAAIDYVVRPSDVTIRIHPDDRAIVSEALPAIVQSAEQVQHAELIDDDSIQRGGCMITYGKGSIDATLDGQLDRAVEALLPSKPREDETA